MVERSMRGTLHRLALLFSALLSFTLESAAGPQLDARLAPMAEIYARNSRMIMSRGVEKQYEAIATYRNRLQVQLAQLSPPETPKGLDSGEFFEGPDGTAYFTEEKQRKPRKLSDTEIVTKNAIERVLRDFGRGVVEPDPRGLPKPERARHDEFTRLLKTARETALKDKQTLDQRYLAALTKLESEANGDQALLDQIKGQIEQVNSGTPAPLTDLTTQLPGSRWQRTNSPKDFLHFPRGPTDRTWSYSVPDAQTVVARFTPQDASAPSTVTTWKLGEDGKTLLKDGVIELQLVHPDVIDLLSQ